MDGIKVPFPKLPTSRVPWSKGPNLNVWQLLIATVYVGLFMLNAVAFVGLLSGTSSSIALGIVAAVASSFTHIAMTFTAVALIDQYVIYPVYPRLLFLLADLVNAVMCGLVLGNLATDQHAMLIIANFVVAGVMALQVWRVAAVLFSLFLYDKVKCIGA
jgi:hypothetical protein